MTNEELIIACTLDPELVRERVGEWQRLVADAEDIERRSDGVGLTFPRETAPNAADIAALAEAERDCCPFFTFLLRVDHEGTRLDVTAPPSARVLVDVLLSLEPVLA